ncbi:MAG TPA: DUF4384 domain-containing protein [Sinorhizobium sp.]|nr:DUF4384 domain-containing protein [Sinorhizobium sp.]
MYWRTLIHLTCLAAVAGFCVAPLEGQTARKDDSEKTVVRTRWMNVLRTGNYTKTDTQPATRPPGTSRPSTSSERDVTTKDLRSVEETAAAGTMLGITVWRMRPAEVSDEVKLKEGDTVVTPVRVKSDTPLREGDRVRLTIEAPRDGYLYVIDREKYADGTLGPATLIFPTRRLLDGDNAVNEKVVVEIPAMNDNPPFFTLKRSRPDHEAEMIFVLVSDQPLPDIKIGRNASPTPLQLKDEQINEWLSKWAGPVSRFDLEAGEDAPMAAAQAEVATRTRALVHEDPKPQTLYWLPDANPGTPLMISIPLVILDRGQ